MGIHITRHDASFRVESYNESNNRQVTIEVGEGDRFTLYGLPEKTFWALLTRFCDRHTINYAPVEYEDEPKLTTEDHAENRADIWIKERKEERAFS
jgi:hypothetical protein